MSDRLTSTLIPSESFYTGHSSTNSDKFDIRDYLDRLEKSKKSKNKYVCPICNGSNLAVSPKTGEYHCFSGDCAPRDIREAIAPWADSPRNRKKEKDHFSKKPIRRVKVRSPQKANAPIPDNDGLALATFTPTDSPKVAQKPDRVVTTYQYGENLWVERSDYTDPKKDKITIPYYRCANGAIKGKGEAPWLMYRESEAIAHGLGKFVTMSEGEKCVESLRSVGLVGATFQGGSWTDFDIESGILRLKVAGVAGIAYLPDNDDPGFKKAEKIKSACDKVGMPYVEILPETIGISDIKGGDIFDAIQRWIHAGMSAEQIRETLEKIFRESAEKARSVEQQMIDAIQDADDDDDWTIEDIRYFLGSLADENMPESLVKLNIASLSRESGYAVHTLTQIFTSICKEKESETVADDVKAEITSLLDSQTSSVDIGKILPKPLADPILKLAGWMNLRPEAYLFSLLATASSLPQNGTNLNACTATNYRVSPNLFVAIVAESSQKKSPILKAIATEPLERLHKDECEKFNRALKDFKNLQKQTDNPDDLPPEPQKKVFFVTNTTGEAILRQAGRQSSGILYLTDELKALFGNLNAYRSGKGSDEENLLEYYDGTGGKVLRVDGLRDDVSSLNLGVIGGIQPEVLERLIDGKGDTNGKWARFIFVHQPLAAATLPINGGSIDISDRLAGIYQKIAKLPVLEFRWSSAALKRFAEAYDNLEQLRIKEPNQALRSVIGKTAGRIAKIALNLHIIRWAASEERSIETEIGIESLTAAITLAKFAIQQIKSLYVSFDSDSPAPHLVKILNFAQRKGTWVKAREVAQSFKNMKTDMIRQYFLDLEKAGMGEVRGTGKAIEFLAFGENVGSFVGGVVGNKPTPETLTEQAFGEFVGNVGNVGKTSEIQQPQQPQQPEQPQRHQQPQQPQRHQQPQQPQRHQQPQQPQRHQQPQQPPQPQRHQQPQQPEDKKATMINEIECLEPSLAGHYGSISLITIIESRYRRSTLDALTLEQLADLRNHVHQLNSPKKQASSLDLRS